MALSTVFFDAFWPVLSILGGRFMNPFVFTAICTLCASVVFLGLMVVRRKLHELLIRDAWFPLFMTSLILVAILHPMIGLSMTYTTAGNAAIVMLIEVLYSFLFFGLILGQERYTPAALFGAACMVLGAVMLLFRGSFDPQLGDLMLLGVMALAPVGNWFQQKTRALISTETLLFVRSVIGASLALLISFFFVAPPSVHVLLSAWPFICANTLLVFVLARISWVESIARITVPHALTIRTLTPAFVIVIAFFILGEVPTWWQVAGFLPMAGGAWLILNKDFLRTKMATTAK